jgi:hypothetical protein
LEILFLRGGRSGYREKQKSFETLLHSVPSTLTRLKV